ncbi:Rib/alpha-like domain-containing protein, partial [Lactobacillus crispatus]|uniref:Rib/alpha-like domain-containing protein n=1 Tax=Lactobacillus crispatus TaxID=47770 RepID=UPI0022AC6C4D
DLPEGTHASWGDGAQDLVDKMKPGETKNIPATVEFPDGSTKEVEIPVHKTSQAEEYGDKVETQPVNTDGNGKLPEADTGIKNLGDLPEGTHASWGDGAQDLVDKMKPGEDQNVPATVEFPDGSTKEITIPVHKDELVHPQTRDLDTGKDGSLPDASKSVTNLPDLPKGTEVKWGEGAEETAKNLKPGESAKVPVVITIPGEGTKVVEITITRPKSETVEPKTRDLDTGKDGSLPDASKAVTNLPDLPKGTEVKWGEGAEETAKN